MIFNPITALRPHLFLTFTTATTDSIESITLYLQFFLFTPLIFSPLYLLLRFLQQLLKLGACQYRCCGVMPNLLHLLYSHFTVQYEYIKPYMCVKVTLILAERPTLACAELLTQLLINPVDCSFSILPAGKGSNTHICV
jgi:hypothetical protein